MFGLVTLKWLKRYSNFGFDSGPTINRTFLRETSQQPTINYANTVP